MILRNLTPRRRGRQQSFRGTTVNWISQTAILPDCELANQAVAMGEHGLSQQMLNLRENALAYATELQLLILGVLSAPASIILRDSMKMREQKHHAYCEGLRHGRFGRIRGVRRRLAFHSSAVARVHRRLPHHRSTGMSNGLMA